MADLYASIGQNTRRIFPTSELGTPKITPVIISTDGQTLPSGNDVWADGDNDVDNYDITSDYQTQGDVFLAVQAIQQYCEVYEIGGSSDSNFLTVMCRDSSIPYDAGTTFQNDGSTITILQTLVRAALGGAAVLVTIGRIVDNDSVG
jgi:hypothetical protein